MVGCNVCLYSIVYKQVVGNLFRRVESPHWGSGDVRQNCSLDATTTLTELQNDAWQPHTPHQVFNANYVSCMAVCVCCMSLFMCVCLWERECSWTTLDKSNIPAEDSSASSHSDTHTHTDEASRVQLALPIAVGSEPLWGSALWVLLDIKAIKSVEERVRR